MKQPLICLLVGLAVVTSSSTVYAFDCAKASLPVDFVICSGPDVFKANDVHEKAWYETRSRLNEDQKKELLAEQRRWLREYPPNCGVPSRGKPLPVVPKEAQQCVARALLARAEFLRQYPGSATGVQASAQGPSTVPASDDSGRQQTVAKNEPQMPLPSENSSNADAAAGLKDAYDDPFAYCRSIGTIDRPDNRYKGPEVPAGAAAAFGLLPENLRGQTIEWRCAKGKVLACAGERFCGKVSDIGKDSAPTSYLFSFCQSMPNADFIPYSATGHSNLYEWRCDNRTPKKVKQVNTADEQEYLVGPWAMVKEGVAQSPNDALYHASAAGEMSGIEAALNKGADINAVAIDGSSALSLAVAADRTEVAAYLLKHGADAEWESPQPKQSGPPSTRRSLLFYVKSAEMVDLLVEAGVDPNKADKDGNCPIFPSVSGRGPSSDRKINMAITRELLAKGANARCFNKGGRTALHEVSYDDLVKLLVDHGANVDAVAEDWLGFTPLHAAANWGNVEVVRALLAAGAKNIPDKRGAYPIDIARIGPASNVRQELVSLLSPFESAFDAIGQTIIAPNAKSDLPSDAGIAFVKSLVTSGCTTIPVGVREGYISNGQIMLSGGMFGGNPDTVNAPIFQKLGVIEMRHTGHLIGDIEQVTVNLRYQPDGKSIRLMNGAPCLQNYDYSRSVTTMTRTDSVKGGATGWTGVVAYFSVAGLIPRYLYKMYLTNKPDAALPDPSNYRVLYRQDAFSGKWRVVTWDLYSGDQFLSTRVVEQLRSD